MKSPKETFPQRSRNHPMPASLRLVLMDNLPVELQHPPENGQGGEWALEDEEPGAEKEESEVQGEDDATVFQRASGLLIESLEFFLGRSLTDLMAHFDYEAAAEGLEEEAAPVLPTLVLSMAYERGEGEGEGEGAGRMDLILADAGAGIPPHRPALGRLLRCAFSPLPAASPPTFQALATLLLRTQLRTALLEEKHVRIYDIAFNPQSRQPEFQPPKGELEEKDDSLGPFSGTQLSLSLHSVPPSLASSLLLQLHGLCLQSSILTSTDVTIEFTVSGLSEEQVRAAFALQGQQNASRGPSGSPSPLDAALHFRSIPTGPSLSLQGEEEVESGRLRFPGFMAQLDPPDGGEEDRRTLTLTYGNPLPDDLGTKLDFFYYATQGLPIVRQAAASGLGTSSGGETQEGGGDVALGREAAPPAGPGGKAERRAPGPLRVLVGVGLSGDDALASQREALGLGSPPSSPASSSPEDDAERSDGSEGERKGKGRAGGSKAAGVSLQASVLLGLGSGPRSPPSPGDPTPAGPLSSLVPVYVWENRVVGPCKGSRGLSYSKSAPQIKLADWTSISLRPSARAALRRPSFSDLLHFGRPFAMLELQSDTVAARSAIVPSASESLEVLAVCLHLYNEHPTSPQSFPGVGSRGPRTSFLNPMIKAAVNAAIHDAKLQARESLQSGFELRVRDLLPSLALAVARMAARDPALTDVAADLLRCDDPSQFERSILWRLRRVVLGEEGRDEGEEEERRALLAAIPEEEAQLVGGPGPVGLPPLEGLLGPEQEEAELAQLEAEGVEEEGGDFDPFADLLDAGVRALALEDGHASEGPFPGEQPPPHPPYLDYGSMAPLSRMHPHDPYQAQQQYHYSGAQQQQYPWGMGDASQLSHHVEAVLMQQQAQRAPPPAIFRPVFEAPAFHQQPYYHHWSMQQQLMQGQQEMEEDDF